MTDPSPPVTTATAHRRVNVIGVVMSVVFLAVASIGLTGNPWWLIDPGAKWIVAGATGLVGLGLLASALPGRRRP